jgi:hypothetical protein
MVSSCLYSLVVTSREQLYAATASGGGGDGDGDGGGVGVGAHVRHVISMLSLSL